ncbi:phage holin family protein [Lysinibacillus irui]|uniref:Phage holin family protein n=1 Tax=Lysinibacillus irui TaxID=2998077 RepID=A0ABU5NQM4_9BACI|nr:phage holin family protein [Lysinibacillus irui]MEA0556088.1 phage holin family protein [Lysinibacillus irui]MEA0978342.1 phage holin family protein [Lysinibacillus irui]MEA1044496.1 phage holin family protein [Lysinibacillus irui]
MEKWIAAVSGVVGTVISYSVDGLGMAVTVMIGFMAIDYITGIMSGVVNRNLNSRVGFNGAMRKIYYLLLVGSVYLLSVVIPGIEYAGDGAAIAFCVLEFISITENGTKMGLPMPDVVKNILAIVKDKTGEGEVK